MTEGSESFSDEQFASIYPDGIEDHWWQRARNDVVAAEIRRAGAASREILDVGCGRGPTVLHLRRRGFRCRGVELAPARPLPGAEAHIRTGVALADLPLAERRGVGVALLLDVIEHVAEPRAFLREIRASLPDLTLVVITVPARPELWTNYDVFNGHYLRYTRDGLRRVCEDLGWGVERIGHLFHAFYLAGLLIARLGLDRPTQVAPPGKLAWAHALLGRLMRIEARVLPPAWYGTTVIAACRPGEERVVRTPHPPLTRSLERGE